MVINSSATCPPNRKHRQNKTNIKLINITLYTLRCGPLTETHHKARTRQQQNKNSYRTQNNRKTIQQHCQGVEEISLRKATHKEALHHRPMKAGKPRYSPPTSKDKDEKEKAATAQRLHKTEKSN